MRNLKITVLETTFQTALAEEYGAKGLGPCPCHKKGEVFITDGERQPEGLCDEAWKAFSHYAFALVHGSQGFWEDWIPQRNISIHSCNDGLRPVIFKLEVLEEEQK